MIECHFCGKAATHLDTDKDITICGDHIEYLGATLTCAACKAPFPQGQNAYTYNPNSTDLRYVCKKCYGTETAKAFDEWQDEGILWR